ncbi:hypothetical protein ACE198_01835 [Neobacillus sp. KR4-4]|uniref:hypothetical protein n=1 Tax=Neobacillus sp. KR4-4 TaxID=3344872 RepID=UPI0035CC70C7
MNVWLIKRKIRREQTRLFNVAYDVKWFFSNRKTSEVCLNRIPRPCEIIVSLTTFPERIISCVKTIRSILNQKDIKPDRVELWLAYDQFPNGEKNLPTEMLELKSLGLEICWCEDLRSYKKLIPALIKHPDSIIVTADDDVYYNEHWLERLYNSYLNMPQYVHCHRATKMVFENNGFKTIPGGLSYYSEPSYLNKLVGIGGVLYPPKILYKDVTDVERFMKLAPTNDDIWFWLMAVKANTKISVVQGNIPQPVDVLLADKSPKLTNINDRGQKLFWIQFDQILSAYPEIKEKLISSWRDFKGIE